jgi:hypothetical protein
MAVHTIRSHTPSACDVGLQAFANGCSGHHARQSSHRVPVGVRLIARASGLSTRARPQRDIQRDRGSPLPEATGASRRRG